MRELEDLTMYQLKVSIQQAKKLVRLCNTEETQTTLKALQKEKQQRDIAIYGAYETLQKNFDGFKKLSLTKFLEKMELEEVKK